MLVDTLLGSWLHAWKLKRATKLVSHPKFYFFDAGVARALSTRLPYLPTAEEMGTIFETYLLHEVRAFLSYTDRRYPLHFFRTFDGVEIDLLFESADGMVAIEFKSSPTRRGDSHKGFRRIQSELDGVRCIGVYTGSRRLKHDGIVVYPYGEFLGPCGRRSCSPEGQLSWGPPPRPCVVPWDEAARLQKSSCALSLKMRGSRMSCGVRHAAP